MDFSEKLCLKWNDFSVNLPSVFSELRHVGEFSDVTLACEDGRVEAHRLVLSSASPVFRRILQPTLHPHPLVYMRGLKVATLEAVLDFIYSGEANILEDQLEAFLAIARELQLKGLEGSEPQAKEDAKNCFKPDLEPKSIPGFTFLAHSQGLVKSEDKQLSKTVYLENKQHTYKMYDEENKVKENDRKAKAKTMMEELDGAWFCKVCGKSMKRKGHLRAHVESHMDVKYTCKPCDRSYRTWDNLREHFRSKQHSLDIHEGIEYKKEVRGEQENTLTYFKPSLQAEKDLVDHKTLMEEVDGIWACKVCGKKIAKGPNDKGILKVHVECHMARLQYNCDTCDKTFRTRDVLRGHYNRVHKAW